VEGFLSSGQASTSERVPQLDGVRGIAIALVLLYHYSFVLYHPPPGSPGAYALKLLDLSWSGVDLFFVLSGYLIGGLLLDHVHDPNGFRVFYTRRFFRIVPLYLVVLVISSASPGGVSPLVYFLTFTQNIWMAEHATFHVNYFVTWSLAVEEQFYLALPVVIWLLPRKWLGAVLSLLMVAAPIFRLISLNFNPVAPHILFPCRMDALLCGVLCAYAMRQETFRQWLSRNTITLYGVLAILLIWPALATLKEWDSGTYEMESLGLTLLAFTYACFMLIAISEKTGPITWLTSFPLLRRMGLLAYCIYLIHMFVLDFVFRVVPGRNFLPGPILVLVLSGIVICIAEVSWRFFERPLISFGHRWRYSGKLTSPELGL
jgi:peptidoglycan/LPS O-acetylase OafA/YrhL